MALLAVGTAKASAELPPQGVYEGCSPGTNPRACLQRLRAIRGAGFTLVLNYSLWYGTAQQVRDYLDRAAALGLEVILPFNHPSWRFDEQPLTTNYTRLAGTRRSLSNAQFIAWVIGMVRAHPAVWGYYVGDETAPEELGLVQRLGARIRATDPGHPQLFVSGESQQTAGNQLAPFASAADVLGSDWYPVGVGWPIGAIAPLAERMQQIADRSGRKSAAVLQSFSWSQYSSATPSDVPWPTREEMLRMRDLALAHSDPQFILWYSFHDILRSSDPARHFADLVGAAFAPEPAAPRDGGADDTDDTGGAGRSRLAVRLDAPATVRAHGRRRKRARYAPALRVWLNRAATVTVHARRVGRGRAASIATPRRAARLAITERRRAGTSRVFLPRRLRSGRYVIRARAAAAGATATDRAVVRLARKHRR